MFTLVPTSVKIILALDAFIGACRSLHASDCRQTRGHKKYHIINKSGMHCQLNQENSEAREGNKFGGIK